jgi:galactose mutarotase-like enzyme
LILGPGLAWQLHRRGRFSSLKRQIKTQLNAGSPTDLDAGRPGGQDAILLTRKQTAGSDQPEFLSATLLPGMGMTVLQITANLPGRGETNLLASPSVQAVASGAMEPPNGFMDDHGAIEVPWGGMLMGAATPVGTTVIATWKGRTIEESTEGSTQPVAAEGGTLLLESSDSQTKETTADGMKATALFRNMNTDDRWPSKTDVRVSAQLEAHAIDLAVTAKNTGDHEEPMGIGWHPRFELGEGRGKVQVKLPNGEFLEIADASTGLPSGNFTQAPAEIAQFQSHPAELGTDELNASIVNMRAVEPGSGPSFELRNPAAGYGIRLTALSAGIRQLHAVAPAEGGYISLGLQSNLDDPFGKEWNATPGGGIAVLQPGESMEWRVRLEIFPVSKQ